MTDNPRPVLEVVGLCKSFPLSRSFGAMLRATPPRKLRAVDSVSFAVQRGRTLGIVGESGCGKSTLARCLVRLGEPDAGAILFEGEDVLGLRGAARQHYNRQVQMVFQDPYGSLDPRQKVGSALGEALRVHDIVPPGQIASRIGALLDLVGLPRDAAMRYPHEFSGGQRQRIGIARALAVEPQVLIADEPVSALDVSVQAQIVNLLLDLQARLGLTLIFISHDLRIIRHVAHAIAVMYLGKIVEIGPAQALFDAPRHPYTRALLAAVPDLRPGQRGREAVTGEIPSPLAPPPGCAFHPRCPIMQPRCRQIAPQLDFRGGGWPVACHEAGVSAVAVTAG